MSKDKKEEKKQTAPAADEIKEEVKTEESEIEAKEADGKKPEAEKAEEKKPEEKKGKEKKPVNVKKEILSWILTLGAAVIIAPCMTLNVHNFEEEDHVSFANEQWPGLGGSRRAGCSIRHRPRFFNAPRRPQ